MILGWSEKIDTLVSELAAAGANQRDACVVVLADKDKVAMDEHLAGGRLGHRALALPQDLGATGRGDFDGFHASGKGGHRGEPRACGVMGAET